MQWDYDLEIVDNSGVYIVQPFSTATSFSSYQWVRNGGYNIPGANNSFYTPTVSGTYTVVANASCGGTRTSNALIYSAPNTQCSSTPATYSTCSTTYNLSYTPASNYDVTWYECDATGNNGTLLNSSPSNTIAVSPSNTTDQTFYYYYVCTDNYSYATCTSAVITVEFNGTLNIHGGTSLPTTLSANTPNIAYSSYQWYRNGQAIIGATSNVLNATIAGDYYMTCTSATCGSSTSNTITFGCGLAATYTNHHFTAAGNSNINNISNTTVIFDGVITIDEGAVVNISNSQVFMKADASIIVSNNSINTSVNGGELSITGSCVSSCDDWQGIFVRGTNSSIAQSSASGKLYMRTSYISEAYIAIFGDNNARIDIQTTNFEENYMHVQLNNFSGTSSSHGVEIDFSSCNFKPLMASTPSSSLPGFVPSLNTSTYRPFVYIYDSKTISFTSCNFNCLNYASPRDQIGLDIIIVSGAASGVPGFSINSCIFDGEFNTAVYIEDGQDVAIGDVSTSNEIKGDFTNGISINGGQDVSVTYNNIHHAGSHGNTALKMDQTIQSFTSLVTHNIFKDCVNGMELYFDRSGSNNTDTYVIHNTFENNGYGLVYAPVCYPIGSPSCNVGHYSAGFSTTAFHFDCNKFISNGWGLVGCGQMNEQGQSNTNPKNDWGSFFCGSGSTSTSSLGDIAWFNNTLWVTHQTTLKFGAASSISIDGTTVNAANIGSYIQPSIGTTNSCYQSFKTSSILDSAVFSHIQGESKFENIYPNPFNTELIIQGFEGKIAIELFSLLGQRALTCQAQGDKVLLPLGNIAPGCYFIKITNMESNKIIEYRRAIKTGE